jgi:hypothetical protein
MRFSLVSLSTNDRIVPSDRVDSAPFYRALLNIHGYSITAVEITLIRTVGLNGIVPTCVQNVHNPVLVQQLL